MVEKAAKRVILIDDPSSEDLFHGKGHEKTAIALSNTILEFSDVDRAIGIDGPWGSGKSSIVEIADKKLQISENKTNPKFHFFTFDIWKSQGSAFRRSFLEHLLFWSKNNFPSKKITLNKIEDKVKSKTKVIDTNNQVMLDWYGIFVLVCLPFLPIYYFWVKKYFDKNTTEDFLNSPSFYVLLIFLVITILRIFVYRIKDDRTLRDSLSRTLLISSKQYEDQKVTQHIRETDPNDFEFQATLLEILETIQDKNNKIVIVLDNIDRLPADEINEYWALVRSIFSRSSISKLKSNNAITAIVPYSRIHIQENLKHSINDDNEGKLSKLSSRELFSKTFDEILVVAPPVMSNAKDFFEEKLVQALPDFEDKDEFFRIYLIFNSILRSDNGHTTPRQIISFINDLTGLYTMHKEQFKLTVIAVYMAYRDEIENDPSVLTDPNFLNLRLKSLTKEADIEMKLAALVYNVEEYLAFQLLLDNKISDAATSEESSELLKLSKSPGFDIRVNEVILDNATEWIEAEEYGQAVENFSQIYQEYSGDAKKQFSTTLISKFSEISQISLSKNDYNPFFKLFQFSGNTNTNTLAYRIAFRVMKALKEKKDFSFDSGTNWNEFINTLQNQVNKDNKKVDINFVLSRLILPTTANFMFGVGSSSNKNNIKLKSYRSAKITLVDDEKELEKFALEDPALAISTFIAFKDANILTQKNWIEVGNSIVETLSTTAIDDPDYCSDLLNILVLVWNYSKKEKGLKTKIEALFAANQFYTNLYACYSEAPEHHGIAYAVLLASQFYLRDDQTIPYRSPSTSNSIWFNSLFTGEEELTNAQMKIIALDIKQEQFGTNKWLEEGEKQEENLLINNVLSYLFKSEKIPHINLIRLIDKLPFLRSLLKEDYIPMMAKYAGQITDNELNEISLEICSLELLSSSFKTKNDGWDKFHNEISRQLQSIDTRQWKVYFAATDHIMYLLEEIISSKGIIFETTDFRDAYQEFISSILNGELSSLEYDIDYDELLGTINKSYHGEIYRKIRETTISASNIQMKLFFENFTTLVKGVLTNGDRIARHEKDNIIRNFLCPALETSSVDILNIFIRIGRVKISTFINSSTETTQEKLEGALNSFLAKNSGTNFATQVVELIKGKRKSKSFLERLFRANNQDE